MERERVVLLSTSKMGLFFTVGIIITIFITLSVLIVYGPESISPLLHDIFHDVRHALGMGCH